MPLYIKLWDHDKVVVLSVLKGLEEASKTDHVDVQMHSSSLQFVLENEYGFDTLCINGRFETTPEGFSKMARSFFIGLLNNMGISLGFSVLANPKLCLHLIRLMFKVRKHLSIDT